MRAVIRRWSILSLITALLLGFGVALAQPAKKLPRIGFLWDSPAVFPDALDAFRQALRELGYVDGQTISIEYRWAEGNPERMRALANELVKLKVDAIIAPTSIYTGAAKQATSKIPIIFMSHADPIGSGHVSSLARPGGNATGLSIMMTDTSVKGLELLKETVPSLSRVAVIWDPATPSHGPGIKVLETEGPRLGLRIQAVAMRNSAEFDNGFSALSGEHAGAVLVLSTPIFIAGAKRLADLAVTYKVPSMFSPKQHVEAGGLMSYSPDRADLFRRGAVYVDKVLKGAKPADLPVQQPTKFELVINLKTAKHIGLTIPPNVLARADRVIK